MTGIELKERLQATHISLSEIARRMGIKPQDLNALFNVQDTKTGTIERLANALDLPIAYFFGDAYGVNGNNNATGTNNVVNASDERLLTLLMNKDEQLTMAMKQTSKAQAQIDEVLAMLKNK
ncbi:MAG: helix-turn-helix transcriptional regulator [Bacteroidales bacterium]|nr:helix-turn-helix transcriptional regulator [Bacteroidales bacterium]